VALTQVYRQRNVDLTILKHLNDRMGALYGATYTGRIFRDRLADPTALDARRAALRYWIELFVVSHGTGLKVPTIVQADCFWTVGSEGDQATTDRYGDKLTGMVDDLLGALSNATSGIRMLDFSAVVTTSHTPAPLDQWIICRNSRGQLGLPESRRRFGNDRGLGRETLTFHFWYLQDLHGPQVYF